MEQYVNLPLYPDVDYSYAITLQGDFYRLRFTYNEVMKLYTLKISDVDGNTLISGLGLVPNYPIASDHIVGNLTGTFLLLPKADTNLEFYKTYPLKLNEYYELSYVYNDPN